MHGAPEVSLVRGDITLASTLLPEAVSVGLIDVDLSEPTYHALRRLYERLSPGGILLVDDCPDDTSWQAREGLQRFVTEAKVMYEVRFGIGIVRNEQ